MFTDDPATPLRLEALVAVLWELGRGEGITNTDVHGLLQPDGLPDMTSRDQAKATLKAARELGLVTQDGSRVYPTDDGLGVNGSWGDVIRRAIDDRVLASTEVEPYFALFYAYLLGDKGSSLREEGLKDQATNFNEAVFGGELPANPLNETKLRGLLRWYPYTGLGWLDSGAVFHCNPYDRLLRKLPDIFEPERVLTSDLFMTALADRCPELDGGALFLRSNPGYVAGRRVCTRGVAHALVDLHRDGEVELNCPPDSSGWSLALAEPPRDGHNLRSERVDTIRWVAHGGKA